MIAVLHKVEGLTVRSFNFANWIPCFVADNEKVEVPDVIIKEWVWSKSNPYQTPELVKAEQIGWGVPTIQRLWFG